MAKEYTPSEYLKVCRKECATISPSSADIQIEMLRHPNVDGLTTMLAIPPYIPMRYRVRMQKVWAEMTANILFSRTTKKISYAERLKMAQKIK